MELFLKTAAGCMLSLILILMLGKQERDLAAMLSIAVCCMIALTALTTLAPVMDFLRRLETEGNFGPFGLDSIVKMVGIGLVSELVATLCQDAGNASLGKQVQLLAGIVILKLSLPLLETLLELIENLLGDL